MAEEVGLCPGGRGGLPGDSGRAVAEKVQDYLAAGIASSG